MIEYEDFVAAAPGGGAREEKDAWFEEREINPIALLRVGYEYAETRLAALEEGDMVGQRELTVALQIAVAFGFELGLRVLEARA